MDIVFSQWVVDICGIIATFFVGASILALASFPVAFTIIKFFAKKRI